MNSEPQACDLGNASQTEYINDLIKILRQQEARRLSDKLSQTVTEFVKVSAFEGLSLPQYVLAKNARCKQIHNYCETCLKCSGLINAAKLIIEKNVVSLSYLWNKCYPNISYDSGKAQRKFLQMPICVLNVNKVIYITAKKGTDINYYMSMRSNIQSNAVAQAKSFVPNEEYKVLLSAAQGDSEKKLLKHVLCETQNMSKRQASKVYGISKMKERATEINKASVGIKQKKDRHIALAKLEQKEFLLSCGASIDEYLTSSSESCNETDSETSESDDSSCESERNIFNSEILDKRNVSVLHLLDTGVKANLSHIMESAASLLKEVSLNWFSFVLLFQSKFASDVEPSAVDTLITEFVSKLKNLGFTEEQIMEVEQSRLAYLETLQQNERSLNDPLFSSTDSSEDEVREPVVGDKTRIKTKLRRIKDKVRKRAIKETEQRRFLRKKISKSTKTIIDEYNDIGDVIESIVQESDVGADRWRRTRSVHFFWRH